MLALILVGFVMMTLGVALLFLGEVPFLGGKRISAWRSRLIGLVQISFLPLAIGAWLGARQLLDPEAVTGVAVAWSLCGFCWFLTVILLFRVMFPKKVPRKSTANAAEAFDAFEAEAPPEPMAFMEAEPEPPAPPAKRQVETKKKSPVKREPAPPADDGDPFNFS